MTDFSHLPLFVDDFEAATAHLTLEEDGAYNRLMRLCWRTPGCSIPDDDRWIMRRMRVDRETYERIVRPIIEEFFTTQRGRVFQKRLKKEHDYVRSVSERRKEAGKKGGQAKARKTNKTVSSKRKDLPEQNSSKPVAPTPTPTPTPKDPPLPPNGGQGDLLGGAKPGTPETPLSVLSQVVSEERAKAFIEHRKKLRKPMTVHAARLAISELRKMPDPAASVDQSIMNGWAGVFPVKAGNQNQGPRSSILDQIRREEARAAGGER